MKKSGPLFLFFSCPLVANWVALGPFGGPAAVVQTDRFHSGTVLAATRDARIFRTIDGGGLWTEVFFPGQFRGTLRAFVVDDRVPSVYLVGLTSDDSEYAGLYRTSDSGRSWTRLPGLAGKNVWAIATWPPDADVIAAGTETGVYLSRDGGAHWDAISPADNRALQPVVSLAFDPTDANILYAGTPHLPWRTIDGGASWQEAHTGMVDDSDIFSIEFDRRRPGRLFVGACSGMYRSVNGGRNWRRLTSARGSPRTYQVIRHPGYENMVFAATTQGLERSDDGGNTWRALGRYATQSIAFDPTRRRRIFIATESDGLLRSDDLGESFQAVNRGFSNRRLDALFVADGVLYVMSAGSARGVDILRRSGSERWERVAALPGRNERQVRQDGVRPLFEMGSRLLAANPPSTWSPSPGETPANPCRGCTVDKVISAGGTTLLAATSHGLRRSTDLGRTWITAGSHIGWNTVKALCSHPSRDGVAYVSSFGAIFVTEDAGDTWTRIASETNINVVIKDMAVMPGTPDQLIVLTHSQGVFALTLK
jgi:photosystem II stability/assembly factor-like uncharacterized protein